MLKLKGRTGLGKNRIKEHGEEWILRENLTSPIRPNDVLIESVKTGHMRWMCMDFEIVEKKNT